MPAGGHKQHVAGQAKAAEDEDPSSKHYCVDVGGAVAYDIAPTPAFGALQAIALKSKVWPQRAHIKISFIGGTERQREIVRNTVRHNYQPLVNLHLDFVETDGDVRVSFVEDEGAWSLLGTDALLVKDGSPTMNLGWLDDPPEKGSDCCYGVVKHEFGHCIGAFLHEHQNPVGGIIWNEEVVEASLSGAPNFWKKEEVENNMYMRYKHNEYAGTEYDPDSIMHYFFPKSWVMNKNLNPKVNQNLSKQDKYFLQLMYPIHQVQIPPQMVDADVDLDEVYQMSMPAQPDTKRDQTPDKTPNHTLSDRQVLMIALGCIVLMTIVGYFMGKADCKARANKWG